MSAAVNGRQAELWGDEQWQALKAHGTEKKVNLMGDIPFGVGRYSADVWALPDVFDHRWCGGCPRAPPATCTFCACTVCTTSLAVSWRNDIFPGSSQTRML